MGTLCGPPFPAHPTTPFSPNMQNGHDGVALPWRSGDTSGPSQAFAVKHGTSSRPSHALAVKQRAGGGLVRAGGRLVWARGPETIRPPQPSSAEHRRGCGLVRVGGRAPPVPSPLGSFSIRPVGSEEVTGLLLAYA